MEQNKELLNETRYQDTKKKIIRVSLIILIISILLGGALIVLGSYKAGESKEVIAKKKAESQKQLEILKRDYNAKEYECNSLNMRDADWYTKSTQCEREANDINAKIMEIEHDHTDSIEVKYVFLAIIGAFIAISGSFISLMIYLIAKRREITAFGVQQMMPIAKEGIDKMAPTVGNAASTVAQGITKGIKEGLNNEKNK